MYLTNQFDPIRQWAVDKGIIPNGNAKTQSLKLVEEVGELAKAIIEDDAAEIRDAIGDCVVVLVSLSYLTGNTIEDCINGAYDVIKNRKGKMSNGTFIKNERDAEEGTQTC